MKQKFIVTGMTCSACSAHVDKAVRKLAGVSEVNVNLLCPKLDRPAPRSGHAPPLTPWRRT